MSALPWVRLILYLQDAALFLQSAEQSLTDDDPISDDYAPQVQYWSLTLIYQETLHQFVIMYVSCIGLNLCEEQLLQKLTVTYS